MSLTRFTFSGTTFTATDSRCRFILALRRLYLKCSGPTAASNTYLIRRPPSGGCKHQTDQDQPDQNPCANGGRRVRMKDVRRGPARRNSPKGKEGRTSNRLVDFQSVLGPNFPGPNGEHEKAVK